MQLPQLHHSHGEEQLLQKKYKKKKQKMHWDGEWSCTSYSLSVA